MLSLARSLPAPRSLSHHRPPRAARRSPCSPLARYRVNSRVTRKNDTQRHAQRFCSRRPDRSMFLPRGAAEIDFSLERQRVQAACVLGLGLGLGSGPWLGLGSGLESWSVVRVRVGLGVRVRVGPSTYLRGRHVRSRSSAAARAAEELNESSRAGAEGGWCGLEEGARADCGPTLWRALSTAAQAPLTSGPIRSRRP